jgi:hypothetical protein
VARDIFQACPVWLYTQSNITQATLLILSDLLQGCSIKSDAVMI